MLRSRSGRGAVCAVLLAFCFWALPLPAATPSNTSLTAIKIVGVSLLVIEAAHQLVKLTLKLSRIPPKPKKPRQHPDMNRYRNLFTELTNISQPTNLVTVQTNPVIPPGGETPTNLAVAVSNTSAVSNVEPGPATNLLLTRLQSIATQAAISNIAETLAPDNRIVTNKLTAAVFSNLSPTERQDVMLFGWDHYYLVAQQYYKVRKFEKSREFMFHSIAIRMMVPEATSFLKEKFGLTDREIRDGTNRYQQSRE